MCYSMDIRENLVIFMSVAAMPLLGLPWVVGRSGGLGWVGAGSWVLCSF